MTDEEYKEFLNALARKHFQSRRFRHRMQTDEVQFLIERLSAAGRLNQAAAERPDSKELRDALVGELNRISIIPAVGIMDRVGVIDALEEGTRLVFKNLRRSAIPAEDVALMRQSGVRDPEAEMTIVIHYTRRYVGRHGTRAAAVLRGADHELRRAVVSLENTSEGDQAKRSEKANVFNGIGKILAGVVTGVGNTLLGVGTIVAPNPAIAYGVIASAALGVGSVCQGIGDLRGENAVVH